MTGRHPNRYGTFSPGYSLRPEEITTAALLRQAGYACGHFGKWHLGPVKATSPTNPGKMGFEKWLSHDNFFELDPYLSRNGGDPIRFQGESSAIIVKEAIDFIDEAVASNRPFFVVIWFGSPHEPYSGLPEDLALYDQLPETFGDRRVTLTSNETDNRRSGYNEMSCANVSPKSRLWIELSEHFVRILEVEIRSQIPFFGIAETMVLRAKLLPPSRFELKKDRFTKEGSEFRGWSNGQIVSRCPHAPR